MQEKNISDDVEDGDQDDTGNDIELQTTEMATVAEPPRDGSVIAQKGRCMMITAHVARMYRFCLMCVCVCPRAKKLIISSLHHILLYMGRVWTHSGTVSYTHLTLPTILRV